MFGPTGVLRGKQEECLKAAIEGLSPLFIILPTGMGKSLLFMIPALFETAKSTIVVVPLVALAENLLKECEKFKVDAMIWERELPRYAKVIIIVADAVVNPICRRFIQNCYIDGDLERIVFDECHMVVTEETYRPKLRELWRLNLAVQMVFMSATYPPLFAPLFQEKMVTKEPFTIREANHKPRTCYSVAVYDKQSDVYDIVREACERCIDEEKV